MHFMRKFSSSFGSFFLFFTEEMKHEFISERKVERNAVWVEVMEAMIIHKWHYLMTAQIIDAPVLNLNDSRTSLHSFQPSFATISLLFISWFS
jgi:predicted NAD/FAD-dependent oxidoreductase